MKHELQQKILDILPRCKDMTVATVRPDGAPQATVVSFVHDGLTLYFGCGAESQKAKNIAQEPRVSVTMTPPYDDWMQIEGLSMAATASEVIVPSGFAEVGRMMYERFPQIADVGPVSPDAVKIFRLRPEIVSILDYTKGFGHTDLVTVGASDIAETLESMRHHWVVPAD
ncbi:MAG: pyridoxamine 5'-phosphate oxidase family protein [Sphingomonadales bacterium]|nr:pyridoxamine 5'-phosphate oxidase family protein [Sphingomonadales bacterium]